MADKAISELVSAEQITPTDMFVLEQNGTAKKLTGQVLLNWLTAAADGHGGIQSIVKKSTSGLVDTYRITLADTTTFDFLVTNGKSINTITKVSTSGLVDTYRINFNDNTSQTYTVTNGAKGDKGDNAYIWVKYASQEPSAGSSSFGDLPDDWMGVYFGTASTAPTDWQQYKWYRIKGEKGDTGEPATVVSNKVDYQVSSSGVIIPSGSWQENVPLVPQGQYLWTRITTQFNTGEPATAYSVSRFGIDGAGSVSSVANISPDENGNVPLTAENVGALPNTGGDMTGELRMNGQPISCLNLPTADDQAANKGYVDAAKREANTYTNQQMKKAAPWNLLDNSYWRNPNEIVNQRGQSSYTGISGASAGYGIDRWYINRANAILTITNDGIEIDNSANGSNTAILTERVNIPTPGEYTISAETDEGLCFAIYTLSGTTLSLTEKNDLQKCRVQLSISSGLLIAQIVVSAGAVTNCKWAALYEGEYTAETLPECRPKGYDAELLACQTQLQRFHTEVERKTYCEDFRPTMRMTPNGMVSKFEKIIDGVTYYFASAEL